MADFTLTETIPAPPAKVWDTVRDFGNGAWMGAEVTCEGEGEGAVRTITMPNGQMKEQCERLDDDERVLGYTIVEGGGLPFEDYHATMTVNDGEGGDTELVWSATYEPVGDPATAEQVLEMIYGAGAAGLSKHLTS